MSKRLTAEQQVALINFIKSYTCTNLNELTNKAVAKSAQIWLHFPVTERMVRYYWQSSAVSGTKQQEPAGSFKALYAAVSAGFQRLGAADVLTEEFYKEMEANRECCHG